MIKSYLPSFIAGFCGALVCLVLLGAGVIGLLLASPVGDDLRNRLDTMIDRMVAEKNLADSAGNHSDVIDVVDATSAAVASIVITKDVPKLERIIDGGSRSPFGFFSFPQYRQNGTEEKEIGGGSGFLVSDNGYVVTNAHVVNQSDAKYTVLLNDGSSYDAVVIDSDATLDIAVLKIDASGLPFLTFGDSDAVKVGQTVIAIGNALGEFRNTVSVGVISGLSRSIVAGGGGTSEVLSDVLQTDAAINPGNSGGPLLDLSGHVIGVNVATSSGGENISFSLPSNTVRIAIESIQETGHVVLPYLGVRYQMLTEEIATMNELSVSEGALVIRGENRGELAVVPGSPADKAGIEENDILLNINDVVLDGEHPLGNVLRKYSVGETVMITLIHDGEEKTVSVLLAERPDES